MVRFSDSLSRRRKQGGPIVGPREQLGRACGGSQLGVHPQMILELGGPADSVGVEDEYRSSLLPLEPVVWGPLLSLLPTL